MAVVEIVYDNRDNESLVVFKQNNVAIDLSSATRFVLVVGGVTIDTNVSATAIETTLVTGELKFDIGGFNIPVGKHEATLIVYDPSSPNGKVFACAEDEELYFWVKEC